MSNTMRDEYDELSELVKMTWTLFLTILAVGTIAVGCIIVITAIVDMCEYRAEYAAAPPAPPRPQYTPAPKRGPLCVVCAEAEELYHRAETERVERMRTARRLAEAELSNIEKRIEADIIRLSVTTAISEGDTPADIRRKAATSITSATTRKAELERTIRHNPTD
jgi:hypothetical protein